MTTFTKRFFSAILATALLVVIHFFFPTKGLVYLCLLLSWLSAREYNRLTFSHFKSSKRLKLLFYGLVLSNYCFMVFQPSWAMSFFSISVLLSIVMCLLAAPFRQDLEQLKQWSLRSSFGLFYCGLLPSFAGKILLLEEGLILFALVFVAVFSGDTLAYIIGVNFGKNKILPHLSPLKTVEGSFGGLAGSLLSTVSFGIYFFPSTPVWSFFLLGLCLGVFAQSGDFFESLLKRINGVKDSGKFMPGHGGVLDRIDSLLFALPVMYLFILIFMQ